MDHYLLETALGICFRIVGNLYQKIRDIAVSVIVNEDSKESGTLALILHAPPYTTSFANVEVELHQVRLEKDSLALQIFAEFQHNEIGGEPSFKDTTIESLINKYEKLKPLVTESINHITDDFTNPTQRIRKIARALKVRYTVHDQLYEANEDFEYDYDLDEISATATPYLESLFDIRSMVVSESKDD